MNIYFAIYHFFLVSHFPRVRRGLVGGSVVTSDEIVVSPLPPEKSVSSTVIATAPITIELPTQKPKKTRQSCIPFTGLGWNWPTISWPNLTVTSQPAVEMAASASVTPSIWATAKIWALNGLIAVSVIVAGLVIAPELYYYFMPADTEPISSLESGSPLGGSFVRSQSGEESQATPSPLPLPPKDETLPEGEWIIIPRIGVRTQLQATDNVDEALNTGVWMAPEYGRPGATDQPVIAAAHRYGWQWWWKDDYWKYHSFYLLPELQPGDIIETISDQRKYYYEVYAGEEGDEITDYMADMILYTCKFLNSPVRHFRYARLIDMTQDTQLSNVVK